MHDFPVQARGYRLTTAHVRYHLPDDYDALETFVWQTVDLVPDLPRIRRFLDFWIREIEGKLHSVTVGAGLLIRPVSLDHVGVPITLN